MLTAKMSRASGVLPFVALVITAANFLTDASEIVTLEPGFCSTEAVCCPGEPCELTENVGGDVMIGCPKGQLCTAQGCVKDYKYAGPPPPPKRRCPDSIKKCYWVPSCAGKDKDCKGDLVEGCQPHFICNNFMGHCESLLKG